MIILQCAQYAEPSHFGLSLMILGVPSEFVSSVMADFGIFNPRGSNSCHSVSSAAFVYRGILTSVPAFSVVALPVSVKSSAANHRTSQLALLPR